LKKVRYFKEREVITIMRQVLSVILYLHQRDIVHRDLKLENLLFTSDGYQNLNLKLIDFGFACKFRDQSMTNILGSPFYMAPEIILREEYDEKVDIWSLGCLAYILLSGDSPF
jgi:calcium-dependent protein kinase